jgi:hypothetical protein
MFACVPGTLTCLSPSHSIGSARWLGGGSDGVEVAMDGANPPSHSRLDPPSPVGSSDGRGQRFFGKGGAGKK